MSIQTIIRPVPQEEYSSLSPIRPAAAGPQDLEPEPESEDDSGELIKRASGRMLIGDCVAVCLAGATGIRRIRTFDASKPAPATLGDVLRLADAAAATAVWIDPHSALRARIAGDVAAFCADVPELPNVPRDKDTGDIYAWQSIQREGARRVTVAFPLPNEPKGYTWTPPAPAAGETEHETAGEQVERFTHDLRGTFYADAALGYRLGPTPSRTGRSLAAHKNSRRGWWQPAARDYRMVVPEGVQVQSGSAAAVDWRRLLTSSERDMLERGGWLHAFDKRAAYLAAMGTVTLPLGEPFYQDGGTFGKVERQHAGLWHVCLTWPTDTPWNGRELPRIGASDGTPCWLWTPDLAFAQRMGATVEVIGAIRWPEDHQLLKTIKDALWTARRSLEVPSADYPDEPARAWAYSAIKAIYTTTYGVFGWRGRNTATEATNTPDELHEPDDREPAKWWHREWAHMIRAEAAAHTYSRLDALYRAGVHPVQCHIDAFAIITDSETPPALPAAIKTDPAICGSLRHEWQAPGADILPHLLSPHTTPSYRPAGATHGHMLPSIRK